MQELNDESFIRRTTRMRKIKGAIWVEFWIDVDGKPEPQAICFQALRPRGGRSDVYVIPLAPDDARHLAGVFTQAADGGPESAGVSAAAH